jgi:hypothetical protein
MRRIPRAVAILGVIWLFFTNQSTYYWIAARYGVFGVDVFFGMSEMPITGLLLKIPMLYLRNQSRLEGGHELSGPVLWKQDYLYADILPIETR